MPVFTHKKEFIVKFTKSVLLFFVSIFLLTGFAITACSPDDESPIDAYCQEEEMLDEDLRELDRLEGMRSLSAAQRNEVRDALIADCINVMSSHPCGSERAYSWQCNKGVSKNERDKIGEQVDNCYDERFSCQDSEDACDSAYDACIDKINWPCASQDEKLDACIDKNKKLDAFYESIDEYAKTKETLTKLGIDYGSYFDE